MRISDWSSDVCSSDLVILANPPFKGSLDEEDVHRTLTATVKTKKTELLFVALILRMLKLGGRSATVVPDGVLFGSSKAHLSLRKKLVDENQRSEERRVGKECVSPCRSRWSPYH